MTNSITIKPGSKTQVNSSAGSKTNIAPAIKGIAGDPGPRGLPGPAGVNNIVDIREFSLESTDGLQDIIFPNDEQYQPNKNALFLYVDGQYFDKSKYIEFDVHTVRLITPLAANRQIVVKYISYQDAENINASGVVISDTAPNDIAYDGLMWFDMVSGTMSVFANGFGFRQLTYRTDFSSNQITIFMEGGSF